MELDDEILGDEALFADDELEEDDTALSTTTDDLVEAEEEAAPIIPPADQITSAAEMERALDALEALEQHEAQARRDAVAQADALLAEHNDEVPNSTEEYEVLRDWVEGYERLKALQDAGGEAEDAEVEPEREPIDFSTWDSASFTDLMARVEGRVSASAPRGAVSGDEFSGALALMRGDD